VAQTIPTTNTHRAPGEVPAPEPVPVDADGKPPSPKLIKAKV
jgi:hypothetical protein